MKEPHLANGASFLENGFPLINKDHEDNSFDELKKFHVSYFETVTDKNPRNSDLSEFYWAIKSGTYKEQVQIIRSEQSKDRRSTEKVRLLPCITTSGTFANGHNAKGLIAHSGLLQIDFDEIPDLQKHRVRLASDPFTFLGFVSPSGTGYKLVVKIDSENHSSCFTELQDYYLKYYDLRIDEKCKDVSRLMFFSYDENIVLNANSKIFHPMKNLAQEVETVISRIEESRIDIVPDYDRWLKIGFALAETFNEDGRDYFHRISKFNAEYDRSKSNNQYSACLRNEGSGVTIKTFFYLAKESGIEIGISNAKSKVQKQKSETEKNETSKFVIVKNYINKRYDLRYNIVANQFESRQKGDDGYKEINENNLFVELQSNNIHFSQANLAALLRSDFVAPYDPLKEYFENLPDWDQKIDHIKNLCSYIKAKDQERFDNHFKKMLVRCLACSLNGVFNKHAFVLIGGQSSGKTYFTRWLCPLRLSEYKAENINTDKDSLIALSENFLIILDELATLHKSELNAFKSFFTKDTIKVRRPFERRATSSVRRANFLGSTNREEFLNDETGSVRWLCFKIESIDFSYSQKIDVEKIWAQALFLLRSGFKCELSPEELKENERVNSAHQSLTTEIDLLQKHFEPATKDKHDHFMTATDILFALSREYNGLSRLSPISIGRGLSFLEFEQTCIRIEGKKVPTKGYYVSIIKAFQVGSPTTNP